MENRSFKNKNDWYYNLFKDKLASLIPDGHNVILDLGCATGQLGYNLRKLNKAHELVGVEIFKEAADHASKYYEKVFCGDIEQINLNYEGYFDFVICADILEHLRDPWNALRRIHGCLKDDGHILISIPNVRYWRVLRNLIFRGLWEYVDAGILDNTHLRFFTRKSFLKMLEEAGFNIQYNKFDINGVKHNLFNKVTFRVFEEFMGTQIIVMARKKESATGRNIAQARDKE
jgi:2-polyprenyl-3-methyl-5-hydroxy-6-metoxy-1,4-benzoquinol methylase